MELPLYLQYDGNKTVLRFHNEYVFFDGRPTDYLAKECLLRGSSMEGRIASFKYLTDTRQKPAVLVSELTNHIYFPSESPKRSTCLWLLYNDIVRVDKIDYANSLVTFVNSDKIVAGVNKRVIDKQIKRCELFLRKLNEAETLRFSVLKGDTNV